MAVVDPTAAKVRPLPGTLRRDFIAGGAGDVGDLVYMKSDGTVDLADGSAAGTAVVLGIVVSAGTAGATAFVAGDAVSVVLAGPVTGFSGLTAGALLYLSDTSGSFDTAAGTVSVKVAVCISADSILMRPSL